VNRAHIPADVVYALAAIILATTAGLTAAGKRSLDDAESSAVSGGVFYTCYDYLICKCAGLTNSQAPCDGCIIGGTPCSICENYASYIRMCYFTLIGSCSTGTINCGRVMTSTICFIGTDGQYYCGPDPNVSPSVYSDNSVCANAPWCI
jgi:hypothetical protein